MLVAESSELLLCPKCKRYVPDLHGEDKLCFECSLPIFAFPLIRQVFPDLIARDIVSVQPMMSPPTTLFFK